MEKEEECFERPYPKELYYNAWKVCTTDTETDILNHMGGNPTMSPEMKWPTCGTHGPLTFLWQFKENDDTILSCFMCIRTDQKEYDEHNWIWPNSKCCCEDYNSVPKTLICHAYVYDCAYCFMRTAIKDNLQSRNHHETQNGLKIVENDLQLKRIKLVRPREKFEQEGDCYRIGNKLIHSDVLYDEEKICENKAWNNAVCLFKTKGMMVQHDIPRGYGYISMGDRARSLPIWSLNNPGIFNVSKGLIMNHEI